MTWFRRAAALKSESERHDDQIGEALIRLHDLYQQAEEKGWHFRPQARLAREALRAIHWLP